MKKKKNSKHVKRRTEVGNIKKNPDRRNINSRLAENSRNVNTTEDSNQVRTKKCKNLSEKEKIRKKRNRKRIRVLIFIAFIIALIMFLVSLFKWNKMIKDVINCQNSVILDSNGNVIAVIGESRIQETVTLSEIPDNLEHAYVAIEDKTFYKHHGVNVKRTAGATASYILHRGSSSYGGSTITQQLVKNVTGENETKVTRKIKEWDRAFKTELVLSKDEILQTYFNIIYVGPNIYGVEKGAEYYFDKRVSELDLAECAYMAGINNSPNSYNPFGEKDTSEKIKTRTKTVLKVMLDQQYINNDEYNQAVQEVESGLKFSKGDIEPKGDAVYSYMADATIAEFIEDFADKKNISNSFATNYLYFGGLKIYSTQISEIQSRMEEECEKGRYIIKSSQNKNETTQAAMVIIDHETGKVVGCVGGLGKKEDSRGFNRATQALRQTGSSIKPIAVLGPALEENIITPTTIYDDSITTFENNYQPKDCENSLGNITVRRAVESSQNIPFVKMMEQLTPAKSIKYMEKQGITTLTEKDNSLPLALGGLEKGISPLQMAAAYATIANDGVYIEPIFYTKVENSKGKTILKNKQNSKRVYSVNTSYVLKKLLVQPVIGENGTAKACAIDGMETAAKTGTTDNYYDKWLCGFTKYYTAVTWFGYDANEKINEGANSMANQIWAAVMKDIHKDLIKANFGTQKDVIEVQICKKTGKVANGTCTDTYTEYFKKNNVLKDTCDVQHSPAEKNNKVNNTTVQNQNTNTNEEKKNDTVDTEVPKENTVKKEEKTEKNIEDNNEIIDEDDYDIEDDYEEQDDELEDEDDEYEYDDYDYDIDLNDNIDDDFGTDDYEIDDEE